MVEITDITCKSVAAGGSSPTLLSANRDFVCWCSRVVRLIDPFTCWVPEQVLNVGRWDKKQLLQAAGGNVCLVRRGGVEESFTAEPLGWWQIPAHTLSHSYIRCLVNCASAPVDLRQCSQSSLYSPDCFWHLNSASVWQLPLNHDANPCKSLGMSPACAVVMVEAVCLPKRLQFFTGTHFVQIKLDWSHMRALTVSIFHIHTDIRPYSETSCC